jgi:hypothetical protein
MAMNPFEMLLNNSQFKTAGRSRFLDQGTGGANTSGLGDQRLVPFANVQQEPQIDLKSSFNQVDNADLKKVGKSVFAPEGMNVNFNELDNKDINSLATDNPEKVTEKAKSFYDGGGEITKILGALNKLSTGGKEVDKLYKGLIAKAEPDPAKAKKMVKDFFGTDPEKETPAWADAALAIGQSLLSADPNQTGLQSLGLALGEGGKAAKASKAKTKAKDSAMMQLAFGVYKEDKKSQTALLANYEKFKQKQSENTTKLGKNLTDLLYKDKKFNQDEQEAIRNSITSTANLFPKEVRGDLFQAIAKNRSIFDGVSIDKIPQAIFALAKESGIETNETNASNFVKADIKINDQVQFDFFKQKFPDQFKDIVYDPAKSYTIKGFTDKTKTGAIQDNISQVSVSFSNLNPSKSGFLALLEAEKELNKAIFAEKNPRKRGVLQAELESIKAKITKEITPTDTRPEILKLQSSLEELKKDPAGNASEIKQVEAKIAKAIAQPDNRTALKKEQNDLTSLEQEQKNVSFGAAGRPLEVINREIEQVKARIKKLTEETKGNVVYMGPDGSFYSGPPGAGGIDELKNKSIINEIEKSQVGFVRASYIGDSILQNLAKDIGDESVGAFQALGNLVEAAKLQIGNFGFVMNAEQEAKYDGGNIDALISNNSGKTSNIFKRFKEAAGNNQNLMSAIMDYAFALASSRETGKLTDKDVAAALQTIGGGNIADGDWFVNKDKVINGVSNAINLSSNALGVRMNQFYSKTRNMEEKNGNTDLDQFRYDPIKLIKRLSPDATLYERMYVGKTNFALNGLSYMKFNKYQKAMGNDPNIDPKPEGGGGKTSTLSPELTDLKNKISGISILLNNSNKSVADAAKEQINKILLGLSSEESKLIQEALKQ